MRDAPELHTDFLKNLHAHAKERGIEAESFLARKGDVLVLGADLAHGGAKITDDSLTRRSPDAHYTPVSVKPRYSDKNDFHHEYKHPSRLSFASRRYDLTPLDTGVKEGIVYFNGGYLPVGIGAEKTSAPAVAKSFLSKIAGKLGAKS